MSSVYKVSKEVIFTCDACRTVGDHAEASGFCTNCEEYLCETCFKCHSKNKTSRHHALLDKDNMPKGASKSCVSCKETDDYVEAVKYCTERENYYCNSCFQVPKRSQSMRWEFLRDKDSASKWSVDKIGASIDEMKICNGNGEHVENTEKFSFVRDVNMKATSDDRDCYIAEMTLISSNELLVTDYNNKSLKLFDITDDKMKYTLTLQSPPIGITTIAKDQVAAVLENECKIQIILIAAGLYVVRTINTNGNCVDIKYINGKLYASFWEPVRFQILQPTGVVYKTVRPESEVLKHCTLPSYIDISLDESLIYVSDWKTKKVMSVDMSGKLVSMYQGKLDGPADIVVSPFDSVYLCDRDHHAVYRMTSDLREATVVIRDRKKEASPHALCFNADKEQLYVSSGSTEPNYKNFIKIYQWE